MPLYHPNGVWETALVSLSTMEGKAGRRVRRWLRDRYSARALAAFDARLPQLGPGSVCIDLGANVGVFTERLARSGATVHAYEPDPLAFAELQRNTGHLPNVHLHQAAVAVEGGRCALRRAVSDTQDTLANTIYSSIVHDLPRLFRDADTVDVETRAFGDVLAGIGGPVALVKMDIEGAEMGILRAVFADPAAYDIDAIFCETHEDRDTSLRPEVALMRKASDTLARPYINLYWP